jgi:glycosyltransferase involved in cell wall biosynthesis
MLGAIEAAYLTPIPKITIGEWLSDQLKVRFGAQAFPIFCIGQIVDTDLFRPGPYIWHRLWSFCRPPFRILVAGLYESSCKGVADGLKAVAIMRQQGEPLHLIRVSIGEPSKQEASLTEIDEYYTMISSKAMALLYQRAHLFLAPSRKAEGFGLPFAEALASGLPVVATMIPSYLSFSKEKDYACFVPEADPKAMAQACSQVLHDRALRHRLQRRGPSVVRRRFRGEEIARRLEAVFTRLIPNDWLGPVALLFPIFAGLGLRIEDTRAQKEAPVASFNRGNLDEGRDNANAGDLGIEIY